MSEAEQKNRGEVMRNAVILFILAATTLVLVSGCKKTNANDVEDYHWSHNIQRYENYEAVCYVLNNNSLSCIRKY